MEFTRLMIVLTVSGICNVINSVTGDSFVLENLYQDFYFRTFDGMDIYYALRTAGTHVDMIDASTETRIVREIPLSKIGNGMAVSQDGVQISVVHIAPDDPMSSYVTFIWPSPSFGGQQIYPIPNFKKVNALLAGYNVTYIWSGSSENIVCVNTSTGNATSHVTYHGNVIMAAFTQTLDMIYALDGADEHPQLIRKYAPSKNSCVHAVGHPPFTPTPGHDLGRNLWYVTGTRAFLDTGLLMTIGEADPHLNNTDLKKIGCLSLTRDKRCSEIGTWSGITLWSGPQTANIVLAIKPNDNKIYKFRWDDLTPLGYITEIPKIQANETRVNPLRINWESINVYVLSEYMLADGTKKQGVYHFQMKKDAQ